MLTFAYLNKYFNLLCIFKLLLFFPRNYDQAYLKVY